MTVEDRMGVYSLSSAAICIIVWFILFGIDLQLL